MSQHKISPAEVNGKAIMSRKERARALTEEIRAELHQSYEGFYHAGLKLRQVEWDQLGYKSFGEYVRQELDISEGRASQLVSASKLRPKLPGLNNCKPDQKPEWSESKVRPLLSLDSPQEQVKVARTVAAHIEKHPDVKFTAKLVKTFVEEEKAAPKPPPKEKPVQEGEGNLHRILLKWAYQMEEWGDDLKKNVPKEGWILLREKQPEAMKRFIEACDSLANFAKEGHPDAKRS